MFVFAATLTAMPGVAASQTPAGVQAEADIATAYRTLGLNTGLRFDITGTQTDVNAAGQKRVIPIGGTLYYSSTSSTTGVPLIKVDLVETYNGYKSFEIIADGATVWVYRPVGRPTASYAGNYSATVYGTIGPANTPPNPNYVHDLFTALTRGAPSSGRLSYAVRLIRELFGNPANGPTYYSWIPMPLGIGPTESSAPPSNYQDPVTGLYADPVTGLENLTPPTFFPSPTEYVVYNTAPQRAIAFELMSPSGAGAQTINRIYYSDFERLGVRTRSTSWTITPNVTANFTQANFTAYPAAQMAGWRPIIGPQTGHS